MKKRKLFTKLLSSALILSLLFSNVVFAHNTKTVPQKLSTFEINEYDEIVKIRNSSNSELKKEGYSDEDIKTMRSNKMEQTYIEYSELPKEELALLYDLDDEQIKILKSYNGDPIEDSPQLRAVAAKVSCTVVAMSTSKSAMTVQFQWSWSGLQSKTFTDIIGVRYIGTNTSGSPINLSYNRKSGFCRVKYNCIRKSNSGYHETTVTKYYNDSLSDGNKYGCGSINLYNNAYAKFPASPKIVYDGYTWDKSVVKSGIFQVNVSVIGDVQLLETGFTFAYGHSTISASPSVSFPGTVAIEFSKSVNVVCSKSVRVLQNRKVVNT